MRRALVLAAAAAAWTAGCGIVFAASQHTGIIAGLYWAAATASTVGYGDVHAQGAGGELFSVLVMVTGIPLLAAAFASAAAAHFGRRARDHVDKRLEEHHQAIHERLDRIEGGAPGDVRARGHPPDPD